ncbi:MAG: hypothetical protein J5871_00675 [Bacteroidales bacterium]|nr:hypothetical protein [Bacteroidales bacterium]
MLKTNQSETATGFYAAPEIAYCMVRGQEVIATSLTDNQIDPGTVDDWGSF